jgi:hypothetical protein
MVLMSEPHRTMFLGVCNPHKDQVLIAWMISAKSMKVLFLLFFVVHESWELCGCWGVHF